MISEWPIRAEGHRAPAPPPVPSTGSALALRRPDAAARRLRDATLDLFLPDENRVGDRIRASVSVMLDGVVGAIEFRIRRSLLPHFPQNAELRASLASTTVGIASPLLRDAATLTHPPLMAILLRRAQAFVIGQAITANGGGANGGGANGGGEGLPTEDTDPAIAAAATALLVANARRIDAFGEPALLPDDLPAELFAWLVWHVAAALRRYLHAQYAVEPAFADELLLNAATALFSGHDEGRGVDALGAALAARLFDARRLDGTALAAMLTDGQIAAFTAGLAAAATVPPDEAWPILADPADGRLALLLRAADIDRASAAAILLRLVPAAADIAGEIDLFDDCDAVSAAKALAMLRLPADYRMAISDLDAALGVSAGADMTVAT